MNLYQKLRAFFPELTDADFDPDTATIVLQNDSDGKGDYIKEWNHPTLPRPTEEQLA